jgi:hypothetical protein
MTWNVRNIICVIHRDLRARDIGLDSFVACLKEDPMECKFSILFGGIYFCQCKLRVYIAKRLRK